MSIQIKTINGITQNTTKHLLLDAGAFFVGYNPATDTFESAKTAGKLLGATKGGGSFKAVPKLNIRILGRISDGKSNRDYSNNNQKSTRYSNVR